MSANYSVKRGESLDINFFTGARAIKREVPAGIQIWNFDGEHAGYFVNENGQKVELEYSNYETSENGSLVIKNFGEADVGTYQKEPNPPITKEEADGSISGVPGSEIHIFIEE